MAQHHLIRAYLAELASQLPPQTVEELADGVEETFHHHLRQGKDPSEAAAAATAEFGSPAQITAAFASQSPGRRTALALLSTAPIFAALWGTTLITTQAWTWTIPTAAAVAFGVTLLAVAATLLTVVASDSHRRTRLAAPASIALILLDLAMLAALAIAAPGITWPMTLAVAASITRVTLTVHNLPQLLIA